MGTDIHPIVQVRRSGEYVVSFARSMPIRKLMSTFLADEGPLGWLRSLGEPDDVRIVMGFDS
jgi:hypothetical protein